MNIDGQKQLYKQRIERFKTWLSEIDPKWINKRSWFADLQKIELGENFFYKVFFADISSPKDKNELYTGIFIHVTLNAKKEFGEEFHQVECGLAIEQNLNNTKEEKKHQELLDYLWWISIYKIISKENQLNVGQKSQLEDKRKELANRIQRDIG